MELKYTTTDGRTQVNIEGKGLKDVFENLAEFCEVFENECTVTVNGVTKSSSKVVPRVREIEGNKYYELVCVDPDRDLRGRILSFGQHKQGGTLFPKRTEGEGSEKKYLPNGGWGRFDAKSGGMKYD